MAARSSALLSGSGRPPVALGLAVAVAAVALITVVLYPLGDVAPPVSLGVVYLLAVLLVLDTALPYQCDAALPLLEAIEHQAIAADVPVDGRIERGRTYRHAVRELIDHERFDRIVVAAATDSTDGFTTTDVAWLLDHVPGEVVVLRPGRVIPEAALSVHG